MYDYLMENYGNCTQLDNGGYYAVSKNGDEIYVPANCSGEVGMVAYYPGKDGSRGCADPLRDQINSDNPPPYIITIANNSYDKNNILDTATAVANDNGMTISKVVPVSFSLGGGTSIIKANEYVEKHPDADVSVVCLDGYDLERINQNNLGNLADKQVPIVMVGPAEKSRVRKFSKDFSEMGANVYQVETDNGSHGSINRDALNNGIIDYVMGVTDTYSDVNPKGEACNYHSYKFDPDTGEMYIVEFDQLSGQYYAYNPNVSRYTLADGFEIKTYENEVKNKYMGLSDMSDLSITYLQNPELAASLSDSTVVSDLQYVTSAMNSIRGQVRNSSFLSSLNSQQFRSSSGIPGCIGEIMNQYFDAVGTLLSALSLESEAVVSVGQALADMDADLNNRVDEISDGADMNNSSIAPVSSRSEEVISKPSSQPSANGNYSGQNSNTPGNKNNDNNDNQKNNTSGGDVSNSNDHGTTGSNNYNDTRNVGENEETYVYEDGHKLCIKSNGEKVVSAEYQWTYDSPEEAMEQYNILVEQYKDLDYVDNIVLTGNKVQVIFKKEAYNNMDVDSIKETYYSGGVH